MKGFLSLLIIVGLLAVGWVNRDRLSGLVSKPGASPEAEETLPTLAPPSGAPATSPSALPAPHPAREAQAQVMALYPGVTLPNSALNKKFVALYKDAQSSNPALLSKPDWPLQLAEQAVISLGGKPMARQASTAATQPAAVGKPAAKSVVMYTTSNCGYCKQAKQYFAQKGVSVREIDIESSSMGKQEFKRLGGNGVPLIMIGNKKVEGFDREELDRLL